MSKLKIILSILFSSLFSMSFASDIDLNRQVGNEKSKIKIVEFVSLTCPYCKKFSDDVFKELEEKYIDTNKISFEYIQFPLDNVAFLGAMVSYCVPKKNYSKFVGVILKEQDKFVKTPKDFLESSSIAAGLNAESFKKCITNNELYNQINTRKNNLIKQKNIRRTPTFLINDKVFNWDGSKEQFISEIERLLK